MPPIGPAALVPLISGLRRGVVRWAARSFPYRSDTAAR
jgi:hypothetical protein